MIDPFSFVIGLFTFPAVIGAGMILVAVTGAVKNSGFKR